MQCDFDGCGRLSSRTDLIAGSQPRAGWPDGPARRLVLEQLPGHDRREQSTRLVSYQDQVAKHLSGLSALSPAQHLSFSGVPLLLHAR